MAGVIRPELLRPTTVPTSPGGAGVPGVYKLTTQPSTSAALASPGGKSFESPKPIIVVPAQRPLEPGKITVLRNAQSMLPHSPNQQQLVTLQCSPGIDFTKLPFRPKICRTYLCPVIVGMLSRHSGPIFI
jgi:hypothetical protein